MDEIQLDLPKEHVTRIVLIDGTVLEIHPGKDSQGHFRPKLFAPAGTKVVHEKLTSTAK